MKTAGLFAVGALCLALVLGSGCTKPKVPMGTINGKLTYNGQPAPKGCVVQFSGNVGGSTGTVTDGGTFVASGVKVGKYQVSVMPPADASFPSDPKAAMEMSVKSQKGPDPTAAQKQVPEKYRRPETSGETFEVKEGNNDFVLDMKD